MPTEKFKYPSTKFLRNELIILSATYKQIKLRDLASIFDVTPVRIDQIIHATLQRFFPDEERLCYLTAKAAIREYGDRLLQSKIIDDEIIRELFAEGITIKQAYKELQSKWEKENRSIGQA